MLFKGNRNKALLRSIATSTGDVTERIINAPKHPFFAPPTALLPGRPLTELMRELICGSDFGALPFFDQAAVVRWLNKLEKMDVEERVGYDAVVYYLASLAVLQVKGKSMRIFQHFSRHVPLFLCDIHHLDD